MSWKEQWAAKVLEYRADPCKFVYEILGVEHMEPFQEEALRELMVGAGRVTMRSGHGVGKTAVEAWATLAFMNLYMPCKIAVVANTQKQLRDVTWAEIGLWYQRMPQPLQNQFVYGAELLSLKTNPQICFATARTGSIETPEALQGLHSDNVLVVFEEASGIPNAVFEVGEGILTNEHCRVLMAGNPTRASGYFYDSFHKMRSEWHTMKVPCSASSRVSELYPRRVAKQYGDASNVYRVRVLGEFPTADDQAVIPLAWIEAAIDRKIDLTGGPIIWGVDPNRFGDDETALAKRQGNQMLEPVKAWKGKEAPSLVGKIVAEYEEAEKAKKAPERIMVDAIGLGGPILDFLRQEGLPARGVNVAEAPVIDDKYQRFRDELWFKGRNWFSERQCAIPNDPELIAELSTPLYDFTPSGKIVVQGKKRRKEDKMSALGASPNRADAFLLTLAVPKTVGRQRKRNLPYQNVGYV